MSLPDWKYGAMAVCAACQHSPVAVQAVHQMHSRGFCHADLKNSNAMVTHAPGQVTVKLVDMACSQRQRPGESALSLAPLTAATL